jgi:multidrug efflux pump subunit AcrA (membrane-fusion protein)
LSRKAWVPAGAGAVLLVAVIAAAVLPSGGRQASADARPNTEKVERGPLSAMVSGTGTLTYRARPDGSPFTVTNQAAGVYTELPEAGDKVACGHTLYRVDDRPVLLLCGRVPAYRGLHAGVTGPDVRQLNRNLHVHGAGTAFTPVTGNALRALQRRRGATVNGSLGLGDAVFLPEPVRVAKLAGQVGGPARPGTPVLSATSGKLHVRVDLDASQQGDVARGDRAQITLPGSTTVSGRVAGFGRVAQAGEGSQPAAATIPTFIDLEHPGRAGGLDQAPVGVDITTKGVDDALSVPVTALVGRSGGGFAVEVVRAGGQRELVAVRPGLFDSGGGRVQVEGDLREGDSVVVPSI